MKLHPEWLSWPETKTLIAAFAEYPDSLRFVGGAVRDSLLGREVKEVDAATTRYPGETQSLAIRHGLRAIPTGLEHGTITIVIGEKSFEVTTLRKDIKTDGRHAEVTFTDNWQEDAARRDFTMNALYLSPDGEMFDYFGGETDARSGNVAFIGNPEERIKEDYLRILRFFRFYAHYGKIQPDAKALNACKANAEKLKTLPVERIWQELSKLLTASRTADALQLMHKHGALSFVLGANPNNTDMVRRAEEIAALSSVAISVETKLVALMESVSPAIKAAALAAHLKSSLATRKNMELLQANYPSLMTDLTLVKQKKLVRALGQELAVQALILAWAISDEKAINTHSYHEALVFMRSWQPPKFPVSGSDLMALGKPAGKELGDALAKLEALWEASDYHLTKAELLGKLA
ncbi:MAG: CCA tRNA nucleotidyltransferase [Rickettsiales bacterium]|jgi:poly(A) polymerase|nr:CCA tRNA nucleotidyltransferase [Rickettsiales bacterium]